MPLRCEKSIAAATSMPSTSSPAAARRAVAAQDVAQGLAVDVFHDDERQRAALGLGFAGVEDLDDRRVIEFGGVLRFRGEIAGRTTDRARGRPAGPLTATSRLRRVSRASALRTLPPKPRSFAEFVPVRTGGAASASAIGLPHRPFRLGRFSAGSRRPQLCRCSWECGGPRIEIVSPPPLPCQLRERCPRLHRPIPVSPAPVPPSPGSSVAVSVSPLPVSPAPVPRYRGSSVAVSCAVVAPVVVVSPGGGSRGGVGRGRARGQVSSSVSLGGRLVVVGAGGFPVLGGRGGRVVSSVVVVTVDAGVFGSPVSRIGAGART